MYPSHPVLGTIPNPTHGVCRATALYWIDVNAYMDSSTLLLILCYDFFKINSPVKSLDYRGVKLSLFSYEWVCLVSRT